MFVFQDHNIITNDGGRYDKPHPFGDWFPWERILLWATYWVDYQVYGPVNANGWRNTNILLHLLNASLIGTISRVAGLLFLLHPLTTMGWSYIAGRSGVMSAAFQITIILLVLSDQTPWAILLAAVAMRWLKEDSVIFFPMIAALWVTK